MKNLRSHLLMRPRTGVGKKKYTDSIKSPNHIIFCEHKRAVSSSHSILSAALICYVNRHIMHRCAPPPPPPPFLFLFSYFFIVDSRSVRTFDMEALRILMPFYFP